MADTSNSLWATGRRKSAVARIRLSSGSGNITVNGRALDHYFPIDTQRTHATGPLAAVQATEKFDIMVNVSGGGPAGQAGAVRHGLLQDGRAFRIRWKRVDLVNCDGMMDGITVPF